MRSNAPGYKLFDSFKQFRAFLMEQGKEFYLFEVWHLSCNFGVEDVTKETFKRIESAKLGVETTIDGTEFEEHCGEKMVFTIIAVSQLE
jgi:hypothetical protein